MGVGSLFLALVIAQHLVIEASAEDLTYQFDTYVFYTPQFPHGDLEQGRVVRRCLFPVKITTTFYDAHYHEVTQADQPGRYGAVVRIGLNGSIVLHRFITLYRAPEKIIWADGPMTASAQLPSGTGIDPAVLSHQEHEIGEAIKYGFFGDDTAPADLAILLAGLSEISPNDPPAVNRTGVAARDENWWFGLRQRLGLAQNYQCLLDLPKGYDADVARRWPLILYLHGGDQKGHDLQLVRKSGLLLAVTNGRQLPAIIVSPQCPWYNGWSVPVLSQLLDDVCAKYRVDPDRIYLTGISAGGDATWDFALAHPDRFAAIVPIAGEGDPADAARIKDLPIWAFQGEKDDVVPPDLTIHMVDALQQVGGHPHLTLFPNAGHDSWDQAYATDALYTWLMAQKRGQPEVVTPGVPSP